MLSAAENHAPFIASGRETLPFYSFILSHVYSVGSIPKGFPELSNAVTEMDARKMGEQFRGIGKGEQGCLLLEFEMHLRASGRLLGMAGAAEEQALAPIAGKLRSLQEEREGR